MYSPIGSNSRKGNFPGGQSRRAFEMHDANVPTLICTPSWVSKGAFEGREVTRFEVIRYSLFLLAGQCSIGGAGIPSDQSCTTTMKVVTRDCGSFAAIIGEPGRFAPQFFAASPGA